MTSLPQQPTTNRSGCCIYNNWTLTPLYWDFSSIKSSLIAHFHLYGCKPVTITSWSQLVAGPQNINLNLWANDHNLDVDNVSKCRKLGFWYLKKLISNNPIGKMIKIPAYLYYIFMYILILRQCLFFFFG